MQLIDMFFDEIEDAKKRKVPFIIPIGTIEYHAHHASCGTDTMVINGVMRELEKEKEILRAQALNEGKPEKIIEKMVMGRINKFYQEVCLMEQPFVKDPDMNVEKMIAAKAPGTKIIAFTRYKMGDGLEKKVNDLAAEVAEQIGK